jgi:antitoxin component YwqK of YwqJK toxin-antitoxin module
MNIFKVYFIAIFFIFILNGCKNKQGIYFTKVDTGGRKGLLKSSFNKDGHLIEESVLSLDSVPNGFYKRYFSKNTIECLGFFKEGKKDSIWVCNYENGNPKYKQSWFNGDNFGEQRSYDSVGRIVSYQFNNLHGETIFKSTYDHNGNVLNWNGIPIYCAFSSETIKINEMFVLMYFFGVPPSSSFDLEIEEKNRNNSQIISKKQFERHDIDSLYFARKVLIEKPYTKPGKYLWIARFNYSIAGTIKSDSVLVDVIVH